MNSIKHCSLNFFNTLANKTLFKYNCSTHFHKYFNFHRRFSSQAVDETKELITVEQLGGITLIGINRPEKRNCVNIPTAEALLKAFRDFDDDTKSYAAILYGHGGNFCAGYDLEELAKNSDDLQLPHHRGPMGPTHYETSKPVIGAIEGYAVAGGLELALWCDVRIVDETAVMGVFCRRFGVPLIDGGTIRLPAIVGLGRALDMTLTGRPVRAPEALQIGLANQICACGSAIGRAIFYAEGLEKHPKGAIHVDRKSVRNAFFHPTFESALNEERIRGSEVLVEAREGAKRFLKGEGKHGSFKKSQSSGKMDTSSTPETIS